ncbi:hypothetical protein G3578_10075 [Brevibacillus sp. SYP-B805]|uniref:hypothetical protein n=1 Tax=Brevibacillus sp. SYP-B805 TaxID=1578199 RepID=UPI0013EA626C|nr:hypothetical protein [Brevibacillus sp. SYP-B805]NGQ95499.1 hypothetical protein [Brevibacillus sp. SYP-B805]
MSLQDELASVASFVASVVPGAQVKYDVPTQPVAANLVVRAITNDFESETRYHYRIDRAYQIVAYGADALAVTTKMDAISRKVMDGKTAIPIAGTQRYIRVNGFNFGAPFKTESGLSACIGVLQTEVREARTQEEYEKIWHVYYRNTIRVPL